MKQMKEFWLWMFSLAAIKDLEQTLIIFQRFVPCFTDEV